MPQLQCASHKWLSGLIKCLSFNI